MPWAAIIKLFAYLLTYLLNLHPNCPASQARHPLPMAHLLLTPTPMSLPKHSMWLVKSESKFYFAHETIIYHSWVWSSSLSVLWCSLLHMTSLLFNHFRGLLLTLHSQFLCNRTIGFWIFFPVFSGLPNKVPSTTTGSHKTVSDHSLTKKCPLESLDANV